MTNKTKETSKRSGWKSGIAIVVALLLAFEPGLVYALPQIDQVVAGKIDVLNSEKNVLNINAADNSIVNYKSFSIAEDEAVFLNLPSAGSKMLNRVTGNSLSELYGRLESNGNIFLINPNGIVVGPMGTINAGGLVMSTRGILDDDFLKNKFVFQKDTANSNGNGKGNGKSNGNGNGNGQANDYALVNEGDIVIREGGFGVLIAGAVENSGRIIVPAGKAVLAGGDAVTLNMSGNGLISVTIDKATASSILDQNGNPVTSQVSNTWDMEADGGMVILKAESMPNIFEKAINLDGFTSAQTVKDVGGVVQLVSSGKIDVSGFVDAGTLEVSGSVVGVPQSITIDRDFLDISKLVVKTQDIVKRDIPDLKLTPDSIPVGATVSENEALSRTEEKGVIAQESYTDYKVIATADGIQYLTLSTFGQVSSNDKVIDNVTAQNGKVTSSTTQFVRSVDVVQGISRQESTTETKNNQELTQSENMSLTKQGSVSLDYKIDQLDKTKNSVTTTQFDRDTLVANTSEKMIVDTGNGNQEIVKTRSLALMDERSKTVVDVAVGADLVILMDNKQSTLNVTKVVKHTNYKKDGVEVISTSMSRTAVNQDLTNASGTVAAPDLTSRNVKTQSEVKDLVKTTAFYKVLADGKTQITTDVKTARDIKSGSMITQKSGSVVANAVVQSVTHLDLASQSSTLTTAALSTLVRPLKAVANNQVPAKPAVKVEPLVLVQNIYKTQQQIEKSSLAQQVTDRITVAVNTSKNAAEKIKDGTRQTSATASESTVYTKTVLDSDVVYNEKGITQAQYYSKPSKVTTAAQQVVKPQSSSVTAWDKKTVNTTDVSALNKDAVAAKATTEIVNKVAGNKTDYSYDYIYDRTDEGKYDYASQSRSLAFSQNKVYSANNAAMLGADLKKTDLFKSSDVAAVMKVKPVSTYTQEMDSTSKYALASTYKRSMHQEIGIDQSSWVGADKKRYGTSTRTDSVKNESQSSSKTQYDWSYVYKLNGKINYSVLTSTLAQAAASAKTMVFRSATVPLKY